MNFESVALLEFRYLSWYSVVSANFGFGGGQKVAAQLWKASNFYLSLRAVLIIGFSIA